MQRFRRDDINGAALPDCDADYVKECGMRAPPKVIGFIRKIRELRETGALVELLGAGAGARRNDRFTMPEADITSVTYAPMTYFVAGFKPPRCAALTARERALATAGWAA